MEYLDNTLRANWKKAPNVLIAWVLMASYAYYIKDSPILSDEVFDKMCKHLYDRWDDYSHVHKSLIERESLKAGSLYYLKEGDYTMMTKQAATELIERVYGSFRGREWM